MVKKTDLEDYLKSCGWWAAGGTKHERWTNGTESTRMPRHKEIAYGTAKSVADYAESYLGANAKPAHKRKKPGK